MENDGKNSVRRMMELMMEALRVYTECRSMQLKELRMDDERKEWEAENNALGGGDYGFESEFEWEWD